MHKFLHCLPAWLLNSPCSGHGAFWSSDPLFQTYHPSCCSTARVCHHPELEAQTDAVATSCSHVLVLIGTGVQFLHCLPACLLSSACSGHGAFWSLGPLMFQTHYHNRFSTVLSVVPSACKCAHTNWHCCGNSCTACLPVCLLLPSCSGHGAFWSLGLLMFQTYYHNRFSTFPLTLSVLLC
jgi:hypothetical protein